MRLLLIEDDPTTLKSLEMMLKAEGFNVFSTMHGEEGLDLVKVYDYDLVILDLALPDVDGSDVLKHMRRSKIETPVLILTGNDEIETKLRNFGLGADDYLIKPFQREELIARVSAIIRRSRGHARSVIETGELILDLEAKSVLANGKLIRLTGKEYQIFELLSLRKGTTMTKEMFLNHLYGGMDEPELKIIDVFVCKLRKKLAEATGGHNYIETVWGRGYVLREPEISEQPRALASA